MRSFRCAPWKRVRIFEGISGIFQDAHFLKPVRIFEWAAHLRSRASALGYPLAGAVPFSRKVLQALLRPRSRCCCGKTNLIDKPAGNWKNAGRSTQRSRAALYLGSLLSPFTISCDSHKAKEIRRLRRFRRFEFLNLRHRRNLRIPSLTTDHTDHPRDRRWFLCLTEYANRKHAAQKKSRALDSGTAPHRRDLQLIAVPYSIDSLSLYRILSFASLILRDVLESFHSKIFLALVRSQAAIDLDC
jgi:hypothetical protein